MSSWNGGDWFVGINITEGWVRDRTPDKISSILYKSQVNHVDWILNYILIIYSYLLPIRGCYNNNNNKNKDLVVYKQKMRLPSSYGGWGNLRSRHWQIQCLMRVGFLVHRL